MEPNQMEVLQSIKALEKLPVVKKLLKENKKLAKKNKELRMLVKIITKNIGLFEERERPISNVPIKIEKPDFDSEKSPEVVVLDHKEETACELREKLTKHKVDETVYEEEEIEVTDDEEEEEEADQSGNEEGDADQSGNEEDEEADQSGNEEEEEEEEEADHSGNEEEEDQSGEGDNGGDSPVEEDDVFEIEIKGKTYYTDDQENGIIYDVDDEGEISLEVGKLTNGKPTFYKT
tara:strand:- start:118 stop:819 length:702 start_codon:yes stop_codon:yes gene_type:complete